MISESCGQPWVAEIEPCRRCGLDASAHPAVPLVDPNPAVCNGAPVGFEADCGQQGPHGEHPMVDVRPEQPDFDAWVARRDQAGLMTPAEANAYYATLEDQRAHPIARLLRALATAIDDGLPVPYSIELHGPTFEMFVPSSNPDYLGALRQWGAYLGAEHAEEEPRGNGGRNKYTVCGALPGGAGRVTAWDAVDPPELRDVPTTKRVRTVPLDQLT